MQGGSTLALVVGKKTPRSVKKKKTSEERERGKNRKGDGEQTKESGQVLMLEANSGRLKWRTLLNSGSVV